MKRKIAACLLVLLGLLTPWRLLALTAEVFVLRDSRTRTPHTNRLYWEAIDLENRLTRMGWAVSYKPLMDYGIYGVTDSDARTIAVASELSWDARFAVLAHEAAHTQQPTRLTMQQREVFAETVAALLARDGFREHARYLASVKADYLMVLLAYSGEMYAAADYLAR